MTIKQHSSNPLVSIITVNFNGLEYLKMLFESLRQISYEPVEIILVDNASTDESVEYTREHYPEVRIVQNEENYMFARGNNEGIRIAAGEYLCLINNDVRVDRGFIEPVIQFLRSHPDTGICQPKILNLNSPTDFEYAGAAGGFIDRYGYPFLRGRLFFTVEKDEKQYDDIIRLFWASGACLFIRKELINETGGLDEDFILHMEEIDLCWRANLLGWQIHFIPESTIWHKGGGTMSAENPRKVYWNYRNNIFLLVKNLAGVNLIRILLSRLLMDKLAILGELARGNFKAALAIAQAYSWLAGNWRILSRKRDETQKLRRANDDDIFKLVYPGSIVFEYFLKGRKTFSKLTRIDYLLKHTSDY